MDQWVSSRRKFLTQIGVLSTALTFTPSCVFNRPSSKVRFGIITDSHFADRDPSGTRYFRQSIPKTLEAVTEMNKLKLDFCVHLGDFKDQDEIADEKNTLRYLEEMENAFSQFDGPRYHCIGNHDLDSISQEQFQERIENTGIPKSATYFSFDTGGIHFIILDPNFHQDGAPHSKGDYKWFEAFVPPSQLHWLEEDLNKTTLPCVIFSHFTIIHYTKGDAIFHIDNYEAVKSILEKSGKVIAAFHGHVHEETYKHENGIHYLTQFGMVDGDGLDNNSFSVVEISENEIKVEGYKRAQNYHWKV